MNKMSGYYRVRNNMRYFENVSSGKSENKRMDWDEKKKIKRMKFDVSASKFTMLMFVLACGFLALAYFIYIIFGDVDSQYIEDTMPGGVATVFVTLFFWWLFKSSNSLREKQHKKLYGFSIEEAESEDKRKQENKVDKYSDQESDILANQDKEV